MDFKRLGLVDVGAVVAAGVFVVGAFLPMWVTEYPVMTITADLLDVGGGIVAVFAALAAVVLVARGWRAAALVALAAAGSIALWRVIDLGSVEGSTLAYGAYVMAAGLVAGIALLAFGLIRSRAGIRDADEWTTLEASDGFGETVTDLDAARDPSLVVE
jgi:hypothetical protein